MKKHPTIVRKMEKVYQFSREFIKIQTNEKILELEWMTHQFSSELILWLAILFRKKRTNNSLLVFWEKLDASKTPLPIEFIVKMLCISKLVKSRISNQNTWFAS